MSLSLWGQNTPDNQAANDLEQQSYGNIIKFDFVKVLYFSDIGLSYERQLLKHWSVELAAGVVIRNFFGEIFNPHLVYKRFPKKDQRYQLGPSLSLGIKYYLNNKLNGSYVSLEYGIRNYRSQIIEKNLTPMYPVEDLQKSHFMQDFKLIMGSQFFHEAPVDFYFGTGLSLQKTDRVEETDNFLYSSGPVEYYYEKKSFKNVLPLLILGVKFSIGF